MAKANFTLFSKAPLLLIIALFLSKVHCDESLSSSSAPAHGPSSFTEQPKSPDDVLNQIRNKCSDVDINTTNLTEATVDFGHIIHNRPLAILSPSSVADIACIVRVVYRASSVPLTIAPRGKAHSLRGQAQAPGGLVLRMDALPNSLLDVNANGPKPYVDSYGGQVWTNVLNETLNYGLSPRSWTDYIDLTIGGTLSNAGVSGQTFRYGPQINNVYELEVITGKGETFNCSERKNKELFHGVLGGLGQFGIITRARIALAPAPEKVQQVRAFYTNFSTFIMDQEYLISLTSEEDSFDYVEGSIGVSTTRVLGLNASTIFILEAVKYFNKKDRESTDEIIKSLLSELNYIPSTLEIKEFLYEEFLHRKHVAELELRARGLWQVPHPWLSLLVPRSKIKAFADGVFGIFANDNSSATILWYPVKKSLWNSKTSVVLTEEDDEIFYVVSFLNAAVPSASGKNPALDASLTQNANILNFCEASGLGVKQYLAYLTTPEAWQAQFGSARWKAFQERKANYDPLHLLAPGQRIFSRETKTVV